MTDSDLKKLDDRIEGLRAERAALERRMPARNAEIEDQIKVQELNEALHLLRRDRQRMAEALVRDDAATAKATEAVQAFNRRCQSLETDAGRVSALLNDMHRQRGRAVLLADTAAVKATTARIRELQEEHDAHDDARYQVEGHQGGLERAIEAARCGRHRKRSKRAGRTQQKIFKMTKIFFHGIFKTGDDILHPFGGFGGAAGGLVYAGRPVFIWGG